MIFSILPCETPSPNITSHLKESRVIKIYNNISAILCTTLGRRETVSKLEVPSSYKSFWESYILFWGKFSNCISTGRKEHFSHILLIYPSLSAKTYKKQILFMRTSSSKWWKLNPRWRLHGKMLRQKLTTIRFIKARKKDLWNKMALTNYRHPARPSHLVTVYSYISAILSIIFPQADSFFNNSWFPFLDSLSMDFGVEAHTYRWWYKLLRGLHLERASYNFHKQGPRKRGKTSTPK